MENYTIIKVLGRGSYGEVCEAMHKPSGRIVALKKSLYKEIRPGELRDGIPRSTIREIALLRSLESPYVVKFLDSFLAHENGKPMACMVMERSESDLLSFMHNTYGGPSPVPLHVAKHLCYQILLGLQHCHGNNVIHRDLKPANVLVHQNTNGLLVLKIADFGLSRQLNSPIPGFTFRCTRWYRAPEVFLKTIEDSAAVDVWAAGCIFLEMILGYAPFRGNAERETLFAIFSVLGTPNNTTWPGVEELPNWRGLPHWERKNLGTAFRWPQGGVPNPLAIDLMGKMLILNPEHRIDCLDALKHQYFDDIRSNYMSPDLAHVTESEWTTRFNGRLG